MKPSALALAVAVTALPGVAAADPGSYDKEFYRGLERNYQVMRDGSINAMRAEGQANVEAFRRLKESEAATQAGAVRRAQPGRR